MNTVSTATMSKRALALAVVNDFFDMRKCSVFERQPDLLELVDTLYLEVITLGFLPSVRKARFKALSGPCAFNIFVKTNTVLNNWHIPHVQQVLDNSLAPFVQREIKKVSQSWRRWDKDQLMVEIERETKENIQILRAVASEYLFPVLEEILRESNIRDCKKDSDGSRRVGLLAIIGLTLEQLLDYVESLNKATLLDAEVSKKSTAMALILLTYLKPPSLLSFPDAQQLNVCFGVREGTENDVFIENEFWFELYKASAHPVPAHLLQVAFEPPDQSSVRAKKRRTYHTDEHTQSEHNANEP